MPPRQRRPPRWVEDYELEGPSTSAPSSSFEGRTRSGRRVAAPNRYHPEEYEPSFAARGLHGPQDRQPDGPRDPVPPDTGEPRRNRAIQDWVRLVERLRVVYAQINLEDRPPTPETSHGSEEQATSLSEYEPSQNTGSRGSSAMSVGHEPNLLQEERGRDDLPIGWGSAADTRQHYIGPFNVICQKCYAVRWPGEDPALCCPPADNERKVRKLSSIFSEPCPAPLHEMLATYPRGNDRRLFLQRIRAYNNALSFASSGIQVTNLQTQGLKYLEMHGSVYHLIPHVQNPDGEHVFAQIYMVDGDEAQLQRRNQVLHPNHGLDLGHLRMLQGIMQDYNPFANTYASLADTEWYRGQTRESLQRFCLSFMVGRRADGRDRPPVALEMGMVIQNDEFREPGELRVQFVGDGHGSTTIPWSSAYYDTLHFVLLHPRGERGWGHDLSQDFGVSAQDYFRYFTHVRQYPAQFPEDQKEHSMFLHGGRLFEGWILTNFSKVEWCRLRYLKHNQSRLRSDLYSGVTDNIASGEVDAARTGRMVVLPSAFIGGPRYMIEKYHDAMAVIATKGPPSLFITMTCNPKWPEITEALFPGQDSTARPDVVCRVFRMKIKELYKEIKDKEIFGPVEAIIYSIEFQKRGLPHMHMLVTLHRDMRPVTAADINHLVQATLVDAGDDPALHEIVKSHMIHGPCGEANARAPCMCPEGCTKFYPKAFRQRTEINERGFPEYARANDGQGFWYDLYDIEALKPVF